MWEPPSAKGGHASLSTQWKIPLALSSTEFSSKFERGIAAPGLGFKSPPYSVGFFFWCDPAGRTHLRLRRGLREAAGQGDLDQVEQVASLGRSIGPPWWTNSNRWRRAPAMRLSQEKPMKQVARSFALLVALVSAAASLVAALARGAATIDRMLAATRSHIDGQRKRRKGVGSAIRRSIPVRTFVDWRDPPPGYFEIDMVEHCGGPKSDGDFVHTLTLTTDIPAAGQNAWS